VPCIKAYPRLSLATQLPGVFTLLCNCHAFRLFCCLISQIGSYDGAKKQWASRFENNENHDTVQNLGPMATICCSTIAGWTTSICTNPIWVIKTRMQIQLYKSPDNYTSVHRMKKPIISSYLKVIVDALRTVWKEEGIRGLYRGLLPSFFGVSHGVVQFVVYEELNKIVRQWNNEGSVNFMQSFGTGACSKICATVSTYPYQVVKARLQMRPNKGEPPPYVGVLNTIRRIWSSEGGLGFYRGCGLNLLRVTPSSALTLATYEFVSKIMR